jgi:hypothetical protein
VTRPATNAPKHAAPRPSPPRSPSGRRRLEAIGVFFGLLAGFALALVWLVSRGPARPASPVVVASAQPSSPFRISADPQPDPTTLNQEWAAYSDRSTCADWAGGDGISAIRLNSGQLAWFFSDTFLGPASPTTGFSHLSGFLHNSVVIQTTTRRDSTFVTMTGGGACAAQGKPSGTPLASVVGPPRAPGAAKDRYWDADGIEVGGTVVKFYNRYLPGGVPFIPTGTVMATFPVSQLSAAGHGPAYGLVARPGVISLPSYTPSSGGTPVIWGAALLQNGNTIYIYGTQTPDPSAPSRQLYLARVTASQLTSFSAWRFYAGDGQWAGSQRDAQPVAGPAVSSGFSVIDISGRYWLIQADPQAGSQDIDAYPADSPWGPFASSGVTLYTNDEIGLDAAHDYRIMYEARAELALSTSNTLVISYNVNSEAVTAGACVPLSSYTNTVVQPKFIAVPTSLFTGAGGLVDAGSSDYPPIVSRDPSQWADTWSYASGCPPIPGLASVQARPRPRGVTLTWPDDGLGMRYRVYLTGPGESGGGPVAVTASDDITINGLRPGDFQATVVPVNLRENTGASATARFAVSLRSSRPVRSLRDEHVSA